MKKKKKKKRKKKEWANVEDFNVRVRIDHFLLLEHNYQSVNRTTMFVFVHVHIGRERVVGLPRFGSADFVFILSEKFV